MSDQNAELDCPRQVAPFAARTVDAVRTTIGLELSFDSETLPLLDHYLRELPQDAPQTANLIATMAGAYFGETVRRQIGGTWNLVSEDPSTWRLVLPGGLSFVPARLALAAILQDESGEGNADWHAPPKLKAHIEETLARLGNVMETEYYTLSCRFDTLEHIQDVMLATAAAARTQESSNGQAGETNTEA